MVLSANADKDAKYMLQVHVCNDARCIVIRAVLTRQLITRILGTALTVIIRQRR